MMRTTCKPTGFVLPVVLGLILLAALVAVQSATELGNATLLSTQRQLHQRAFEAAESGVAATIEQLTAGLEPAPLQTLRVSAHVGESVSVQTRVSRIILPAGFSADRFAEARYEIRSTGHSARGTEVTVVLGASQLQRIGTP